MSKETIPVTVILTHYRRPYTVLKALMSLANQTVRPREIIVIDDSSPEPEFQILLSNAYSFIPPSTLRVFETPFNVGLGRTRNMAASIATQHYVAMMDDDDTWHPEKLELQYTAFMANPHGAFCFTGGFKGGVKRFPAYRWEYIFDDLYLGQSINHVTGPTMMVNRFHLSSVGGWGLARHTEDLATALRLSVIGTAYCIDQPLIYHPEHNPDSLTGSQGQLKTVYNYLKALTEGARFAVACGHKLPVPLVVRYKQVLTNYMKGQIVRLIK